MITNALPVYNGEEYLEEALKACLAQDMDDFELIIGNDGSTDRTLEIIQDYASIDDRIIVISRKKNLGIGYTINEMFKIARGKYLLNSSSDDINHTNRLSSIVNFFETNKDIDICGHHLNMFGKSNWIFKRPSEHNSIKYLLLALGSMGTGTVSMRAEVFKRFSYNTTIGPMTDYDFLANIITQSDYKMANIQEVLYDFRLHDKNSDESQDRDVQFMRKINIMLRCFVFVYKIDVNMIVKKVANNLNNTTLEELNNARVEITRVSNLLNQQYKESFKIDIGKMFYNQFEYLFNDSNFKYLL
jgi:glycosyltransferase involved in cell wall biosynthesis